ncbi:hypothetical protein D9M68_1005970 [compost metagenome]
MLPLACRRIGRLLRSGRATVTVSEGLGPASAATASTSGAGGFLMNIQNTTSSTRASAMASQSQRLRDCEGVAFMRGL